MKKIILLIFCAIFLQAGLLDFLTVNNANKSYIDKDYKSAIKEYQKIENKQGAKYDLANSYYKAKDYKKALSEYGKVNNPNLKFQKLHNMGNTYAKLGKIDEAIKSYEDALKIKQDKDTKYNLELLKKQKKKQQQKKKNNKKNKKKKEKKQNKNSKNNKNQNKQQKGKNDKQNQKTKGSKQKQGQNKEKQQKPGENQKSKEQKSKKKEEKQKAGKLKKVQPISDMEERKYKKMLNQRGINTLMLPLSTKGEKRNEENPW